MFRPQCCPFQFMACKCLHLHRLLVSCEPWLIFVWGVWKPHQKALLAADGLLATAWGAIKQKGSYWGKRCLFFQSSRASSEADRKTTLQHSSELWSLDRLRVQALECRECLLHVMCETCHPLTSHWPASLSALWRGEVLLCDVIQKYVLHPNIAGSAALIVSGVGVGLMQSYGHSFPLGVAALGC